MAGVVRLRRAGLLAAALVAGTLALPAHAAAADFTWTGLAGVTAWSNANNWAGAAAPSGSVGTLTFPALTSFLCTQEPPIRNCYSGFNDIAGLSVDAITIDDGVRYQLGGSQPLTLGAGGITATT